MDQQKRITYFYNVKFSNFEEILWIVLFTAYNVLVGKISLKSKR